MKRSGVQHEPISYSSLNLKLLACLPIFSPVLLLTVIWQINEKRRSEADLAFNPYLSPVSLDDVFNIDQTEPQPTRLRCVERFKDPI